MIQDGFLVVDKPPGLTSHDVVAVVRAVTGIAKVGHTGTLDPFATGVLPLALGGATRLIQYLDENVKVYDATIRLGTATDTGDPTGQVIEERAVPAFSRPRALIVLAGFVGERMQTPPRYSAVKVGGRPLYEYARKGVEVEAKPRPVRIHAMELEDLDPPRMRVLIRCSRGTYARVLAMEIGQALGTVGHLEALRRVASGPFHLNQAITLSRLADIVAGDPAWDRVLRPGGDRVPWRPREEVLAGLARHVTPARERLAHLPAVSLGAADARRLRQVGTLPPLPPGLTGKVALVEGDQVLAVVDATAPVAPRPPRRA